MKRSDGQYHCRRCWQTIQGDSDLCVICWAELAKPCPVCTLRGADDRYRPKTRGRARIPIDCVACNNERWILLDYEPCLQAIREDNRVTE